MIKTNSVSNIVYDMKVNAITELLYFVTCILSGILVILYTAIYNMR